MGIKENMRKNNGFNTKLKNDEADLISAKQRKRNPTNKHKPKAEKETQRHEEPSEQQQ